jgi:hypothetical protein
MIECETLTDKRICATITLLCCIRDTNVPSPTHDVEQRCYESGAEHQGALLSCPARMRLARLFLRTGLTTCRVYPLGGLPWR